MGDLPGQTDCPHCGAPLAAPRPGAGRKPACPVCGGSLGANDGEPGLQMAAPATVGSATPPPPAWAPGYTEADLAAPAIVCFSEERKVNPLAIGPLVEHFTGLSRSEALRRVVRCKGLLAEGLSLDTARNLVAALGEEGVEAFALPADRAPEAVKEVPIVRVYSAEADALYVERDARGTVKPVPWRHVVAGICTRAEFPGSRTVEVDVEHPVPVVAPGMGAGWVPRTERIRVHQPAASTLRVTLVLAGRPGVAYVLSFDEKQVRYAYLGERILPTQRLNLGRLLEDIMEHCPHGFFPPGFRAAAGGAADRVPKMLGKVDYGNYVRWTICCAAARGLFETSPDRRRQPE